MDPYNEVQRNRLFRAMELSYRQLEPFRQLLRGLVEEYAGSGYGNADARPKHEILVNLMNQAVDAYTMSLVANRPRVLVTSRDRALNYFAKHFQTAINNLIEEIHLDKTLRRAVLDAFFCIGVVKVHMADSVPVQVEVGRWMDPGIPFVSNVPLENFVFDVSATEWQKVKFAGDSYRIPFEDLKDPMFDQEVVKELAPTSRRYSAHDDERLENISRGMETDEDEVEPMIDLADIWIPSEGKIYTFAVDPSKPFAGKHPPLASMDWTGPESGPYPILSFNDVPENIMPSSPASHLSGLSRLANNVLRKQGRRAKSQKNVHLYTPQGAASAKKAQSAGDDEWIEVVDPKEIGELSVGGVDATSQAFFVALMENFDRMAGNLTALLGLGAQSDTVGQEQLISASASKKIAQMQGRVVDFVREVVRMLAYLLWTDQFKTIPGQMQIEGTDGISVDATWQPGDREGDYADYNLDIDVYSMPYQSPNQRVQAINYLLTQIYAPMAPMFQQQGGIINLQVLTDIYADLMNEPRLRDVFQFTTPSAPEQGAAPESPGMPQSTKREYVRRSVPGGTASGNASVEQQSWLAQAGNSGGGGE